MRRLLNLEPILVGNVAKTLLAIGAAWGLAVTDAQGETIVGVIVALMAAFAAFTKKQRDAVTPVKRVEDLGREIGGNAVKLVDRITEGFHL